NTCITPRPPPPSCGGVFAGVFHVHAHKPNPIQGVHADRASYRPWPHFTARLPLRAGGGKGEGGGELRLLPVAPQADGRGVDGLRRREPRPTSGLRLVHADANAGSRVGELLARPPREARRGG